jgi:beta-barrel assembly-enhancing protease
MSKKILIVTILGLLSCAGCTVNPVTGTKEFTLLNPSAAEEKQIGAQYAPEMTKQMGGKIENAQLQSYISQVGQKIAKASHTPNEHFEYAALNDKAVNAFALPGGYIFITKGMLEQLNNEAQLAAILGHETAHVTAHHSATAMGQQIGFELILSTIGATKTPQTVQQVAQISTELAGLKYSRTHENEADSVGLDYMVKAGYNPIGMAQTMEILQKQSGGKSFEWLSTHPNPANRLGTIQDKIHSKYRDAGNLATNEVAFRQNVLQNLK